MTHVYEVVCAFLPLSFSAWKQFFRSYCCSAPFLEDLQIRPLSNFSLMKCFYQLQYVWPYHAALDLDYANSRFIITINFIGLSLFILKSSRMFFSHHSHIPGAISLNSASTLDLDTTVTIFYSSKSQIPT
jgi:hypothetical protein